LVAVVPEYQGRVMTSSARGPRGESLGWVNGALIASGALLEHINPYGGEERFWLGPEGGQFSVFFKADTPYDLEHWQTPALIDSEPFEVVQSSLRQIKFRRDADLTNRAGFTFRMRIERTIRLLDAEQARVLLGIGAGEGVDMVAYESANVVANTGDAAWRKETGLPSIWILGMYPPSPGATVAMPFQAGPESELGPIVNDAYFGKVPDDRLIVDNEKGILFFSADGERRSKIGIGPRRAKDVCGSYDPQRGMLTIVQFTIPENRTTDYVNSMWEDQTEPYGGDAVNSYNDGPPTPGAKPLGPFYELESSSPALALIAGDSYRHMHRTFHFQGDDAALDPIARAVLGVGIGEIKGAFGSAN
jgi:hypothetical protein